MRSFLLAATLLASTVTASAAFAQEQGGQQFFFRHHIAGISSTDGNPWESGEVESPEEPEEPEESKEEPEEEPYVVGALNWTPEIMDDYVEGVYFNKQLRTWFSAGDIISGHNNMTIECVGCTSSIELFTRHIIFPDDRPDVSEFGLMSPFSRAPSYMSVNLNDVYRIGAMNWNASRGPVSIYRNGEFVLQLNSGESHSGAIGDEIRWYYPEDGSGPIIFYDGVPLYEAGE